MKKYLLLIFLLPNFALAQECFSRKDKFTGKQIKTSFVSLSSSSDFDFPFVTLEKVDTTLSLSFNFTTNLKENDFIVDKMLMILKFQDGTAKTYHANSNTGVATTQNNVTVVFQTDLPAKDLFYIKQHPIAIIRISYKGDEDLGYDNEVTKAKAKKIMRAVDCVK